MTQLFSRRHELRKRLLIASAALSVAIAGGLASASAYASSGEPAELYAVPLKDDKNS